MTDRLICEVCNKDLGKAARLFGADEVKRMHDGIHGLQVIEATDVVVELARKSALELPDERGELLRRALAELDFVT